MGIWNKWHFLTVGAGWDRSVVPIYEASARGTSFPLLKTLLTNKCKNSCGFCAFRFGRSCPRESWGTEELARVTIQLWMEGRINGIFLSSSVFKDPDYTTEEQLSVLRTIRKMGYSGYIHLRLMPGVSRHYVGEAVELADRVGVNIEAPNKEAFSELCQDKGDFQEDVVKRLEWIVDEAKRAQARSPEAKLGFAKSGVDAQLVVGAVEDNDAQYLKTSEWLYRELGLRRIYYSGFEPVDHTPLEGRRPCPPYREYRLYQSSFLIRDYGFTFEDLALIVDEDGFLPNVDPKVAFAKKNPDLFPVDLNSADFYDVVKIPGIGPERARKIMDAKERIKFRYASDLEKVLGADLTRYVAPYVVLRDKKLTYFRNE